MVAKQSDSTDFGSGPPQALATGVSHGFQFGAVEASHRAATGAANRRHDTRRWGVMVLNHEQN